MFDSIYVGPAETIGSEQLQPKRKENCVIETMNPQDYWEKYKEKKYVITKFVVASNGTFELEGKLIED